MRSINQLLRCTSSVIALVAASLAATPALTEKANLKSISFNAETGGLQDGTLIEQT